MDRGVFIEILAKNGLRFNENQLKLVTTVGKPVAGIACAGSGKTTSMLGSLLYMTEVLKIDPSRILVITFSKSAVEDIKVRYKGLTDRLDINKHIEFRTFHSLFYYLLRLYNTKKLAILDESKKYGMITKYMYQTGLGYNEELLEKILNLMSYRINNCLFKDEEFYNSPKFIFEDVPKEIYIKINEMYTQEKLKLGLVDFDDLQYLLYTLLKNRPDIVEHARKQWDYFIIDEFQDISKIQMHIMYMIIHPDNHKNIKVVGDDDQAIYGWRGSDNSFILGFDKIFKGAEKIYIDTNYRCPSGILDFAKVCIETNKLRFNKQIKAHNSGGEVWFNRGRTLKEISMKDAVMIEKLIEQGTKPQDIAVLYRDHTSTLFLVDFLLRKNIPINLKSAKGLIYNNKIVTEIFDVLDFIENPNNTDNFIKATTKCIPYYTKQQAEKDSKRIKTIGWENAISKGSYLQRGAVEDLAEAIMLVGARDASKILNAVFRALNNRVGYWTKYLYYTPEEINDIFDYLTDIAEGKSMAQFRKEFEDYRERINMIISTNEPGVNFMTMHSAKGLEFNNVFVVNVSKDRFPNSAILEKMATVYGDKELDKIIEEERRLFYVAMTRAKQNLFISYIKEFSIFVEEILLKKDFPYIKNY